MERGVPFQLIDVLQRHDVPFVIIGGHAVTYHGYVRNTEDMDVIFLRSPEAEQSLLAALVEVNAHWIGNEIDPATGLEQTYPVTAYYVRTTRLMMLCTDFGFLDVFDFVPGYEQQSVAAVFDLAIHSDHGPVVSLDWLRKMKQASGRAKDQIDLENLPNPNK